MFNNLEGAENPKGGAYAMARLNLVLILKFELLCLNY